MGLVKTATTPAKTVPAALAAVPAVTKAYRAVTIP